jgi:hypothetical protein
VPSSDGGLPGEPPVAAGPPSALPPLPTRTPQPTPATPLAAPVPAAGNGSTPAAAPVTAEAPTGPRSNGSTAAAPEVTSSGLVKRVPRRAGADRAVPGSDGPSRGPSTGSTRSPDEVRAMLSRFHSGKQAGKSPNAASAGVPSFDTPPEIKEP